MRLRLAITRLAKLDLDELIVYIGDDDPRAVVAVATRILERIELLRENPELGSSGRRPGTRELVVDGTRYIVAYRIDTAQEQIQILRVLHGARVWPDRL